MHKKKLHHDLWQMVSFESQDFQFESESES